MSDREALIAVRDAFVRTFESNVYGKEVLEHIGRFCHKSTGTYVMGDSHETAYLEGRRSVLLEIERVLAMTDDTIASFVSSDRDR